MLYRSQHEVVASPYHRNANGIRDGHNFFAARELATARAIAKRRGLTWILICIHSGERALYAKDGRNAPGAGAGKPILYDQLQDERPPAWLRAVALPAASGNFRLFEVRD